MKDFFKDVSNPIDIYSTPINLEMEIPDEMPKYTPDNIFDTKIKRETFGGPKELRLRDKYIEIGMFGFVSWRWINPLAEWINGRKCLEIMSGRGWLSHALRTKGVDVIATDDFSWHNGEFNLWNDTVTDIEKIDAVSAVKKYGEEVDIVIVSWPYMDDVTFKSLKQLYEINPNALFVFIGEWNSSVCANDDFYESFCEIEDEEFNKVASRFQSWYSIKDYMYLGKYIDC